MFASDIHLKNPQKDVAHTLTAASKDSLPDPYRGTVELFNDKVVKFQINKAHQHEKLSKNLHSVTSLHAVCLLYLRSSNISSIPNLQLPSCQSNQISMSTL